MTSSSSFELTLTQRGKVIGSVTAGQLQLSATARASREADSRHPIHLRLVRPEGSSLRGAVTIGQELVLALRPGASSGGSIVETLRGEYGEATFAYSEEDPDEPEERRCILELLVFVRPEPELRQLYDSLVAELEAIHVGLAQDIMSRTVHRGEGFTPRPAPVNPEADLELLGRLRDRLTAALRRIGPQPSHSIVQTLHRARWRPGDHVRVGATSELLWDSETVVAGDRAQALGRVRVTRPEVTLDIPEHRQIREHIVRLTARARAVAVHCGRMADFYRRDEQRWGGREDTSVFSRLARPRIERLGQLGEAALALAADFARLLHSSEFIAAASPARSRLSPTPIFLNRPGYREAYQVMLEAGRLAGPSISIGDATIRFRSLSQLYEYWCFARVTTVLGEILGSSEGPGPLRLIDGVYRPEFEPGQALSFVTPSGGRATVTYEPDFAPASDRTASTRFRAALSGAPLRPDITLEVERAGSSPAVLVLDAKSGPRFDRDKLWAYTDYRTRVFDPATGEQPIRQVFFLHRDAQCPPLESLPGYLAGRRGTVHSSIIGAVPAFPGKLAHLRRVIERFLEVCG